MSSVYGTLAWLGEYVGCVSVERGEYASALALVLSLAELDVVHRGMGELERVAEASRTVTLLLRCPLDYDWIADLGSLIVARGGDAGAVGAVLDDFYSRRCSLDVCLLRMIRLADLDMLEGR